jgi:hypothetical protein
LVLDEAFGQLVEVEGAREVFGSTLPPSDRAVSEG